MRPSSTRTAISTDDIRWFLAALTRSDLTAVRFSAAAIRLEFTGAQSHSIDIVSALRVTPASGAALCHRPGDVEPAPLALLLAHLDRAVTAAQLGPEGLRIALAGGLVLLAERPADGGEALVLHSHDPEDGPVLHMPV